MYRPVIFALWPLTALLILPAPVAQSAPSSGPKTVRTAPDITAGKPGQSTAANPDPDAVVPELQRKLSDAERELNEHPAAQPLKTGAPPGSADARLMERRSSLQRLVQTYEQHLDALRNLEQMRQRVADAERQEKEWNGFPAPAPYSVLKVDELRDAARSIALATQGVQTRLTMTESLADTARRNLKTSQERVRQVTERLEGVHDPAKRETLTGERDLAQLRERVESARIGMLEAEKQYIQKELAEARHRSALLDRQLAVAKQEVAFPQEDYEKITKRLETDHRGLMEEMEQAVDEQSRRRQAVAAGEAELSAAKGPASASQNTGQRPQSERVKRLTGAVELNRLRFDNANLHVDMLRQMLSGLEQERHVWEIRFATMQGRLSLEEEREASSKLSAAAKQIQGWKEYGLQQLVMLGSQISDVEDRLEGTTSPATAQHLGQMLDAYRKREDLYRHMLQRADSSLGLIENRQAEFTQRERARSMLVRMKEWGQTTMTLLAGAWQVELFTVDDTIEVDGKTVTGSRSVTLGKVVTALAILIVGYWLAGLLARFAERQATARFQIDPNVANIIRQWAFAFLFVILVILTLLYVKIPITAFAFLGGALAIGVGFGTQNLLKNVISGLLLLIERPLRVGDVIEVDNIRGMVTTIGLRSSTIRDSNGVETLIPNSNLLERNLTNWTYSSFRKRYSLRIAVATGSDARRVKEKLRDLAGQHGQILKEPEPYVLFEDFSEHALVFVLHFWIEIGPSIDPAHVASDLRFMIENSFAEEKIVRK